ncbi:uncharacterized protein LOC134298038 isoform X1 [Anolis carolinensis]|uniref:uncharacterized protein LOC134298038 isoform X1 n=1 Tax=Anolis carolinensis TaxID=28377 RepID=UPI002F2B7443
MKRMEMVPVWLPFLLAAFLVSNIQTVPLEENSTDMKVQAAAERVEDTDHEVHTLNNVIQEHGISTIKDKTSVEQMTKETGIEAKKRSKYPTQKQVLLYLTVGFISLAASIILFATACRHFQLCARKEQDLERGNRNDEKESLMQKDNAVGIKNNSCIIWHCRSKQQ